MFGAAGSGDTSGYGGLVRRVQLPGSSPRPYGGWFDSLADDLEAALAETGLAMADAIERVVESLRPCWRRPSLLRSTMGRTYSVCLGR